MIENPESLVGRRYLCDLRVAGIEPRRAGQREGDRLVTLYMYGERSEISLEELSTMIESGFLVEAPEHGG